MDMFRLNDYVPSAGLNCRMCGKPIDTKTTITMLCKNCKKKVWAQNQRAKFIAKYGVDNPMKLPSIVSKIQDTMQERYGANCAMNVPEFRNKFEKTCNERYGTPYYVNSPEFVNKSCCKSKINEKFAELLNAKGVSFIQERRKDDKRFDFELTDLKTYLEIDPTYTHNVAGNHWDKEGLPKDKQLVKTLIAERSGYRCIHVFDWDSWEDIIQLILPRNLKIYARNCTVRLMKEGSYEEFINDNHIQKQCRGTSIALGLYYYDELVQVMTFGKPRYNKNYLWELLRLCTKRDTTVVGGASKLFSYAVNQLGMDSIISYCDRSKFSGRVYEKMGMKLIRYTEPQEVWSKGNKKITAYLLRQRGYDQLFNTNYGKGTSNEELMIKDGWLPVYDCGQAVYEYGHPINAIIEDESIPLTVDYSEILRSLDKTKEKICQFCGEPFVPNSNFQRYCKRPHYMNCPVCGKQYLVTNNENLKRPPVACSYACRQARMQETSMKKYGIKTPGNNPEARLKARQTFKEKFGAEALMKTDELKDRYKAVMMSKYGVENAMQDPEIMKRALITRENNWISKKHRLFPIKIRPSSALHNHPIDDSDMSIYKLKEKASQEFLKQNGYVQNPKFGKTHTSLGLAKDGTLYQVIRFEKQGDEIILSNFGTRQPFFNPRGYSKLIKFAVDSLGIDDFKARIPRNVADSVTVFSLSLHKIEEGDYDVFWIDCDGTIKAINKQDDLEEIASNNEYFTTDYIDTYQFSNQ